jgi:O-antigen ligase
MMAAYMGVAFYILAKSSPVTALVTAWLAFTLGAIGLGILFLAPEFVVALIGKDLTFTGRTDIWALCIDAINKFPSTGYGYGAFWIDADRGPAAIFKSVLQWDVPTAHNSWLEIGLSFGYPGLITILAMTFFALIKSIWMAVDEVGPFPALMLIQIIMFSLSESILWNQNAHATMLFSFVLCVIAMMNRTKLDEAYTQFSVPHWARPPRTTRRR